MSLDQNSIRNQVRDFIAEYGNNRGVTGIGDDESLLRRNVVDSLGVFRLIAFLEEAFPLSIDDSDIAPENFETIDQITALVARKTGVEPPAAQVAEPVAKLTSA